MSETNNSLIERINLIEKNIEALKRDLSAEYFQMIRRPGQNDGEDPRKAAYIAQLENLATMVANLTHAKNLLNSGEPNIK